MAERIKIIIAALVALAGTIGYYYYNTQPTYVRVGSVLGGLALGALIMFFTQSGKEFIAYAKESIEEAKRVTWPTRKETLQATGVVILFVFIMALFLWAVDAGLLWVTQRLLGIS